MGRRKVSGGQVLMLAAGLSMGGAMAHAAPPPAQDPRDAKIEALSRQVGQNYPVISLRSQFAF